MTSIEDIDAALQQTAPRYRVKTASLFGSYARGDAREGSDVDILIETDDAFSLLDAARFRRELSAVLGTDVDVVSRRAVDGSFAHAVLNDQVLLYERTLRARRLDSGGNRQELHCHMRACRAV